MTAFSVPRPGVLPAQWLDKAVGAGLITWDRALLPEPAIQPASVDLHLGDVAYRLRCSFLPGATTASSNDSRTSSWARSI